ncbi:hydroxysteroid dehydrogenase-like protein 2 [Holotrichia oblita]|uniref:Hydroxysteroid dehydrogenase-like protein 2 n=1 Tax=Holotrichia oblita TaxID=644536 RepID=A0ACB9SNL0_HOLOL|nr:hydroxysteroid dehydrogenase-like protein 2 [Holotrichia oblita]
MNNTGKLAGLTVFITGASRGIGKAIALKAAKDGANIVVAAKTAEAHPKLSGTIYTAAQEIEQAGGKALPCIVDVRNEEQVKAAVQAAVKKFGGIDILINNASAISLTGTADTEMKRYDLMHNINTRGTFLNQGMFTIFEKSKHGHVLNISPPLDMNAAWFTSHVAYTMAKFGMSMCVLGMHEEFKPFGIGVNALWPRKIVYTAATEMLSGGSGDFMKSHSRKPEIMADAAYAILIQDPKIVTGNFFIDDEVLPKYGVYDMDQYACNPLYKDEIFPDFFVGDPEAYKGARDVRMPQTPVKSKIDPKKLPPKTYIDAETITLLERLSLVDCANREGIETLEAAIEFADQIHQVDTTGVEPLITVLEDKPLEVREDKIIEGNCRDDILANASVLQEEYFVAPPGNIPLEPRKNPLHEEQN